LKYPEFSVDESGTFFTVLIFDDYVIKVPRRLKKEVNKSKLNVEKMAKIQNDLAEKIECVLPCKYHDGVLIMQRAPGKRADNYDKAFIDEKLIDIRKKIVGYGYQTQDLGLKNIFYDEESNKITLIDLHLFRENK